MSVKWMNFRCNDILPGFTIEEVFKRYASFSDIHDYSFDDMFTATTTSVTGTTASIWTFNLLTDGLPPNFSIKYHKTSVRQAVVISDIPNDFGAQIFYVIGTDNSGYPTIYMSDNDNGSAITHQVPISTPLEADVEVVFRQQVLDDIETVVWRTITIYMNDAWVTTYSDYRPKVGNDISFGFAAYGTDQVTYTNIRVPELCDTAEFGTIDPGENPASGLSRTMEGRYIKMMVLFDGTFRAWKKKQRDQVMTFTDSVMGFQKEYDIPSLITHARMAGAYIFASDIDKTLISQYGHRFKEVNNSMLLTQSECEEEATNTIKRSQEEAFKSRFKDRFVPILEPEDRILVQGEDWIINDYSINGQKGKLDTSYNLRKYVW